MCPVQQAPPVSRLAMRATACTPLSALHALVRVDRSGALVTSSAVRCFPASCWAFITMPQNLTKSKLAAMQPLHPLPLRLRLSGACKLIRLINLFSYIPFDYTHYWSTLFQTSLSNHHLSKHKHHTHYINFHFHLHRFPSQCIFRLHPTLHQFTLGTQPANMSPSLNGGLRHSASQYKRASLCLHSQC